MTIFSTSPTAIYRVVRRRYSGALDLRSRSCGFESWRSRTAVRTAVWTVGVFDDRVDGRSTVRTAVQTAVRAAVRRPGGRSVLAAVRTVVKNFNRLDGR